MILDREKLTRKIEKNFYTNITLAQAAKISATTVNKARNGYDIRPTTLKKLCTALHCEAKDITAD